MVSSPFEHEPEHEPLQHQLQERQKLIQRLAQELVEANVKIRALETAPQPSQRVGSATEYEETLNQQIHLLTEENRTLRQQVNLLEKRITEIRRERGEMENGQGTLLSNMNQLRDENRRLEQYVQDLPELYRKKFKERMEVLETRLIEMQSENSRLSLAILEMATPLPGDSREIMYLPPMDDDMPPFPGLPEPQ
jgi:chromosome segregation ATPase